MDKLTAFTKKRVPPQWGGGGGIDQGANARNEEWKSESYIKKKERKEEIFN